MSPNTLSTSPIRTAAELWTQFHAPRPAPDLTDFLYSALPDLPYESVALESLPNVTGREFSTKGSVVWFPTKHRAALAKLTITLTGPSEDCSFFFVRIPSKMHIKMKGPGHSMICLSAANLGCRLTLINNTDESARGSTAVFGERGFMAGVRIVLKDSDLVLKRGTLWSDEILVQGSNQHGIVDLATGAIMHSGRNRVTIHEHVWIGRRAIVMLGTEMGAGSILATGGLASRKFPPCCIVAGNPGKVVRMNRSWSDHDRIISDRDKKFIQAMRAAQLPAEKLQSGAESRWREKLLPSPAGIISAGSSMAFGALGAALFNWLT